MLKIKAFSTYPAGNLAYNPPIGLGITYRLDSPPHALHPAFSISEGAILLSKGCCGQDHMSKASSLSYRLQKDFDTWRKRNLSELKILYLFLDAVYLPLRQRIKEREEVLCAYGILESGKKVLLHLALDSRESYDSWLSFLHGYGSQRAWGAVAGNF
jgi:hypothetical protein